jgi:hypothetical protein
MIGSIIAQRMLGRAHAPGSWILQSAPILRAWLARKAHLLRRDRSEARLKQTAIIEGMRRRLFRKLGTMAAVVAINFLLLEIFSRIADPFGISYYPETGKLFRYYDYRGPDWIPQSPEP